MTAVERVQITCLMETVDLKCPCCGNPIWERISPVTAPDWVKCTNCGVEIFVSQNPKSKSLELYCQGG
jgi:predicted RNA-binding Zn-ribbon protein involved in translation (DUF1610 family)